MSTRVRATAIGAAIAALLLTAAACSGSGSGDEGTGAGGSGDAASYDVSLTEFAIVPGEIDVPPGEPLSFVVSNDGTAPHTFAVETGSDTVETPQIQPGESATLEVPALDTGHYKTLCTVPGHAEAGMIGMVMAFEGAGEKPASPTGATGMQGMTGANGAMTPQEMLDGHRSSVEAFPAKTEGAGNEPLEPRIEDGTKVFELTAEEVSWETKPGVFVDAMGFNGTVPGPEVRVRRGDHVRMIVHNEMSQPTTMHLHGVTVPNDMDGVPYITQDPIMPGGFFVYEFDVVDPPGMYVYHSHFNSTEQVGKGLYGAFIVEPNGDDWSALYGERVDVESNLFLGDGPTGFVLNGKEFPATQPIVAERGDGVLIHLANDGAVIHPMHLHGYHFEVVAEDGFVLPKVQRYMADTLMVAPGQRFDLFVRADYPGVWAFHCHILPHVEGPQGMFGMVTALVVQ
ncbi:MAG TPA: multicopper oxidase domain-containing protein [Actinomycetota bacterium]|nr:multicopper oxidase domain-containing protein [Actinomycetota bacterium]